MVFMREYFAKGVPREGVGALRGGALLFGGDRRLANDRALRVCKPGGV